MFRRPYRVRFGQSRRRYRLLALPAGAAALALLLQTPAGEPWASLEITSLAHAAEDTPAPDGPLPATPGAETNSDDDQFPADDGALNDLLNVLQTQTKLATEQRLNVDRVPGMMTVLHGRDLELRGARTVFEALELAPGVQVSMTAAGIRQAVVRGIGKFTRSGKAKLLLNGVPLNPFFSAEAAPIFAIPVEQIDSIEVIRGPGAAIHGEYAFVAVINVITRRDENRVDARTDEHGGWTVAARGHDSWWDGAVKASANVAVYQTNGPDVTIAGDLASQSSFPEVVASGNTPTPSDEREEVVSGMLHLDLWDFEVDLQILQQKLGHFYGFGGIVPDPQADLASNERFLTLTTRYKHSIGKDAEVALSGGLVEYDTKFFSQEAPAGFPFPPGFPDGRFSGFEFPQERRAFLNGDVEYYGLDRHRLLFGMGYAYVNAKEFRVRANRNEQFRPVDVNRPFPARNRRILSAFIQDELLLTDTLTITGGIRVDDYNDSGTNYSPRVAGIFRPAEHHSIKAQYAEAFRPPAFFEGFTDGAFFKGGNTDLEPEQIRSLELAYIYDTSPFVLRASIYRFELSDLIAPGLELESNLQQCPGGSDTRRDRCFRNVGTAELRGAELDLTGRVSRRLKVVGNFSYVDSERPGGSLPGSGQGEGLETRLADVAEITGNLGTVWEPWHGFFLGAQYRFIGSRLRDRSIGLSGVRADDRPRLDQQHAVDLTFTAEDILRSGIEARLGVRNLFDSDTAFPSLSGTYPNDLNRPGREAWLAVSYDW